MADCISKLKLQGGSNMTGTDCGLFTHKSVPVIFEPPCSFKSLQNLCDFIKLNLSYGNLYYRTLLQKHGIFY